MWGLGIRRFANFGFGLLCRICARIREKLGGHDIAHALSSDIAEQKPVLAPKRNGCRACQAYAKDTLRSCSKLRKRISTRPWAADTDSHPTIAMAIDLQKLLITVMKTVIEDNMATSFQQEQIQQCRRQGQP